MGMRRAADLGVDRVAHKKGPAQGTGPALGTAT